MDAREGMYMITKIESGSVVERRKSKTMRRPSKRRNRVRGNSSEKKMEGNRQYAILQLTRSFNCNLQPGDVWLTLKLDEEHMTCCGGTFEGVKKEAKKFVDRLCYRMKKAGVVCKWYLAPSEIDGETGELVRPHAHLVMTGQGFRMENGVLFLRDERVDDIWGQGSVDVQFVRHQKDYYPLAKYIINQSRGVPDEKKYTCSRNLKKPKITRTVVFSGAQLPRACRCHSAAGYKVRPRGRSGFCAVHTRRPAGAGGPGRWAAAASWRGRRPRTPERRRTAREEAAGRQRQPQPAGVHPVRLPDLRRAAKADAEQDRQAPAPVRGALFCCPAGCDVRRGQHHGHRPAALCQREYAVPPAEGLLRELV